MARVGGGYESRYLRAVDSGRPRGVWIRSTRHQRPGEAPRGALWCTVWDAEVGPPYAVKQSLPAPPTEWLAARAEALDRSAAWELRVESRSAGLRHLQREWMYGAPLPRTKLESPLPDATFAGWVEAGGRRLDVSGWRGMVGHNWGSEHAERWVWLHAIGFPESPGAWLDVAIGRIRVGGLTTPWVANGALALEGARHHLGGLRPVGVDARPGALEVRLRGGGVTVRASVTAPLDQTVAFVYADPTGGEHQVLNCSVAKVRLIVERPGVPERELTTPHGGAYELGVRETTHGVAVQPYPDP
jgi:hypothetical protein